MSVLQVWAEGVDDEGVNEAGEEEEEVGVMGEGPARTGKDVGGRVMHGLIFLSISCLVLSPSSSTC